MKKQMKVLGILFMSLCLGSCGGSVSESGTTNTGASPTDNSTIKLHRTGQTISYGTGSIDDGALQKGVAWPNPRFTSGTGGEVACVTDNLTGLMWAKTPDSTQRTWQAALDYANNLILCGHSDWRLPNRKELRTLINYGQSNIATWLNDPAQEFSNVHLGGYWSSSTYASNTGAAWVLGMYTGDMGFAFKTNSDFFTWPVRSGEGMSVAPAKVPKSGQTAVYAVGDDGALETGVAWPSPRFTVGIDMRGT